MFRGGSRGVGAFLWRDGWIGMREDVLHETREGGSCWHDESKEGMDRRFCFGSRGEHGRGQQQTLPDVGHTDLLGIFGVSWLFAMLLFSSSSCRPIRPVAAVSGDDVWFMVSGEGRGRDHSCITG